MKNHSNFVTGFLAASCLFLLMSANTKSNQSAEVPRYFLCYGNTGYITYDAVTGKKRVIEKQKEVKVFENSSLKEFLEYVEK